MADDPNVPDAPTPPQAAADKPPSATPSEPLKGEVSRTDAPGAGVSAAPVAPSREEPPPPLPASPSAATTAVTNGTSSAAGQVTPPASAASAAAVSKPSAPAAEAVASVAPAAPKAAPAAPKPAVSAASAAAAPKAAAPAGAEASATAAAAKAAHAPAAPAPPSGPTDPPPPADAVVPAFIMTLQRVLPGSVTQVSYYVGDWAIIVPVAQLPAVARHLRDAPDAAFDFCSDITATDWPVRKDARFDVVYNLYSTRHRQRVRIKVKVGEQEPVPSMADVWPAANWLEREVWDMFGVNFTGHPDRRRILMPEDWQGFPQRKDYPLEGPGELLMENPIDWLKLRQAREEADIE